MEPIRMFPSKRRLLLLVVVAAAFAVGCLLLINEKPSGWAARLAGQTGWNVVMIVGLVFFGGGAILFTVRLIGNKPTLEIDSAGFSYRGAKFASGRLSCSQVRSVSIGSVTVRSAAHRFLTIQPIQARPVMVPESMLSVPLESVLAEMARFNPYLVVLPPA